MRATSPRRTTPRATSWVALLVALVCSAAAAVLLTTPPRRRSSTVEVQLTLSGVASPDNPTGGSQVGVHPGDSVVMHASAIPTAGAPGGLSGALSGLVAGVAGLQVKILGGNLPGVHYPFTLGKVANCGGAASLPLRSLAKGTYSFKYVVEKVSLLTSVLGAVTGCDKNTVTPTHDQLGHADQGQRQGHRQRRLQRLDRRGDPPAGRPGRHPAAAQSISVKVGPVHTSVNLPGATVGVPNPVPGITSNLPNPPGLGGGGGSRGGGSSHGKHGSKRRRLHPAGLTVPGRGHAARRELRRRGRPAVPGTGRAPGSAASAATSSRAGASVTATAARRADPSNVANAGLLEAGRAG